MVTDMKIEEVKTTIFKTCEGILSRIKEWDNDIDSGITIIEKNEIDIKNIQKYYTEFPEEVVIWQQEKVYRQKIEELTSEMKTFLGKIEDKKQVLLNEKKQLINNDSIITNYISADLKSIFIDRDV